MSNQMIRERTVKTHIQQWEMKAIKNRKPSKPRIPMQDISNNTALKERCQPNVTVRKRKSMMSICSPLPNRDHSERRYSLPKRDMNIPMDICQSCSSSCYANFFGGMRRQREPTIEDFIVAVGEQQNQRLSMRSMAKFMNRDLLNLSLKWSRVVSQDSSLLEYQRDIYPYLGKIAPATLSCECARIEVEAIEFLSSIESADFRKESEKMDDDRRDWDKFDEMDGIEDETNNLANATQGIRNEMKELEMLGNT
eukprot:CAMPEP_0194374866 /NCGR_PEP_ID=MMETSP0174-20130528/23340_1 /TAXON_ID=216777 /ORGANISM="Proboscia alata, Strain PI-D3" /LENGTH=251 /DNA_ID=CAMNT_0039154721 /DNA_START=59 /DNA_END=814 /DNA_ORIENTATION=-